MASVFDPLLFGSLSLKVVEAAQQTPQRLAQLQARRLARLLRAVAPRSAFYRRLLKGRDPGAVMLDELPVVTKAESPCDLRQWVWTRGSLRVAWLRCGSAAHR
jgi:phenylacetate-coenzyme A ligase PaaK-like adenylate-forming protein